MATFIVIAFAALGLIVLLGGLITFTYLCGVLGGAVVAFLLQMSADDNA